MCEPLIEVPLVYSAVYNSTTLSTPVYGYVNDWSRHLIHSNILLPTATYLHADRRNTQESMKKLVGFNESTWMLMVVSGKKKSNEGWRGRMSQRQN